MSLEILVAIPTFVLTAIVSVWRINASQTKRIDQLSLSIHGRIDVLDNKLDSKIDALATRTDSKIDALDEKLDSKIDALDEKLNSKIDALRSEIRSDLGEIRRIQLSLMDATSKLIGRVSYIEGMLDRRQEPPVDDLSPLEMEQS
ncbi:MAG: hypothetical protein F4Z62_03510 [Rhodothermaceae bacterium]|nr:hypothetical protein [Rhodothermaceae bacterium]